MSTNSRSLIIFRNNGTQIPDAMLKLGIEKYPTWCGLAFTLDGDIVTNVDIEQASIEGIKELQTKPAKGEDRPDYTGHDIIFVLGKEENGKKLAFGHHNLQPFNIIVTGEGEDESPQVIAFIDGDLSEYAKDDSPDSRAYLFCKRYLTPKLHDIWELVDGNEEKFAAHLRKPHVEKEIIAAGLSDNDKQLTICILTCAEEKGFMSFMSADNPSEDYPWGFVNDTCGYVEGDGGGNTKDGGDGDSDEDKSTTTTTAFLGRPPANVVKNDVLRAQYLEFHGYATPRNFKNREWHSVLPNKVEAAKAAGWELKPMATVASTTPIKPVSGTSAKEKANAFVKTIDASTLEVMSPEQMKKLEAERVTFFDVTGAKPEDVFNWGEKQYNELVRLLAGSGEDGYKMLTTLLLDQSYAIYRLNQDLEAATTPKEEPKPEPKARPKIRISGS